MNFEQAIIERLFSVGVEAFGEVPNPRPQAFAFVERVGGAVGRVLDEPTVALQCWAPTWADAEALCKRCISELWDVPDGLHVTQLSVSNVTRFADESGQPRYQALIRATCYN